MELIGLIDNYLDSNNSVRFLTLSKDISKNSSLTKNVTKYNFNFPKVKLPYESYKGDSIGVKYFIKVTLKTMRTITYEEEFAVINPNDESILKKNDETISMNVGIKDLLSVLIEFDHINYGIHGTLKGFVSFGKVNLLLTKMEVQILKKETIFGVEAKKKAKPKVLATFELIDGGPYKNETIPFRFFLEPYNLTPSYIDVAGNFSVRYYINLIIKDQRNNRYFKQKEIFLYRLFLKNNKYSNNTWNNNVLDNNEFIDVGDLKNYITEPIDYGDYFSVFNEVDEEEKNKEKGDDDREDEFIYKSNLKGYVQGKEKEFKEKASDNENNNNQEDLSQKYITQINIMRRKEQEDLSLKYMKGYDIMKNKKKDNNNNIQANSPFFNNRITNLRVIDDINNNNCNNMNNNRENEEKLDDLDNNNINNDNNGTDIFGDNNPNMIINSNFPTSKTKKEKDKKKKKKNDKKSNSANNNKEKAKSNQVINIKEKNKYKNNDILINDYYNTDNYIIYENSYQNIFDDKLMHGRIKNNKSEKKNKEEDEKQKEDIFAFNNEEKDNNNIINTNNISITNSINDYNLFYPNEPFSNTLIMSNFPTNYNNIGGDFRQNLMGQRIKKKK